MTGVRSLLVNVLALALIGAGFFFLLKLPVPARELVASNEPTALAVATSAPEALASAVPDTDTAPVQKAASFSPAASAPAMQQVAQEEPGEVRRIEDPYSTPPLSGEVLNAQARAALVNILCMPRSGGLSPITGSGVLIDPRGVILTNAHVAQYVLLSQDRRVDLSCAVRMGAPAVALYTPQVLYIPRAWVEAHAGDILLDRALGTGEHDYALLIITGSVNGAPLPPPAGFPYLSYDAREAIGFTGDSVLVASYPAEFLGGLTTSFSLFPASSATTIRSLHTFDTSSIDLLSLGGVIGAQSGSSGGEVVNAWGKLIGLISTMSEGTTTAERDLHAVTLSYIDRDLKARTGMSLADTLAGDVQARSRLFAETDASRLSDLIVKQLRSR